MCSGVLGTSSQSYKRIVRMGVGPCEGVRISAVPCQMSGTQGNAGVAAGGIKSGLGVGAPEDR